MGSRNDGVGWGVSSSTMRNDATFHHPTMLADYIKKARRWARMGWKADGIVGHLGSPLFLIFGLAPVDFFQRTDIDAEPTAPLFLAGYERRYLEASEAVVDLLIEGVRPYSLAERQRREEIRIQHCEDHFARMSDDR